MYEWQAQIAFCYCDCCGVAWCLFSLLGRLMSYCELRAHGFEAARGWSFVRLWSDSVSHCRRQLIWRCCSEKVTMSYVPSCVMSVPLFSHSSAETPQFPFFLFLGGPSYQASALLSLDAVICLCCGMLPQSIWTPSVLTVLVLNLLGTSLPSGPQDLLFFFVLARTLWSSVCVCGKKPEAGFCHHLGK